MSPETIVRFVETALDGDTNKDAIVRFVETILEGDALGAFIAVLGSPFVAALGNPSLVNVRSCATAGHRWRPLFVVHALFQKCDVCGCVVALHSVPVEDENGVQSTGRYGVSARKLPADSPA